MTHPIGPQRATPASPAKIQAEVDQARRAMADSLRIGDYVQHVSGLSWERIECEAGLHFARRFVAAGKWVKLERPINYDD